MADVIKLIEKSLKKPAKLHNKRGFWTCTADYHAVHKRRGLIATALRIETPARMLDLKRGERVFVEMDRLNMHITVDHVSEPKFLKRRNVYEFFVIVEGRNPKRRS